MTIIFLVEGVESVAFARDFMSRRAPSTKAGEHSRLYVLENSPTSTGFVADHRLALATSKIETALFVLARLVGLKVREAIPLSPPEGEWLNKLARDLMDNRGQSLVLVGEAQPPVAHALAAAINEKLGNSGKTVAYSEIPQESGLGHLPQYVTDSHGGLRQLASDIKNGIVDFVLCLECNPVFTAPRDLHLADLWGQIGFTAHVGLSLDETGKQSTWHVPLAHFLESWGDVRALDGTASLTQPLIAPLYDGRTLSQVLAAALGKGQATSYELVREYWKSNVHGSDFESSWRRYLHDGVIPGSQFPHVSVAVRDPALWAQPRRVIADNETLELEFRPDPTLWDGRYANNPWLQELPKPVTKLTWDNAALMSDALGKKLGLSDGDKVELEFRGQKVLAPVLLVPAQADSTVVVYMGNGRMAAGRIGNQVGFDALVLRRMDALWFGAGLSVKKKGSGYKLATPRDHRHMETLEREIIRRGSFAAFVKNPEGFRTPVRSEEEKIIREPEIPSDQTKYAWGMAINLSACVGCNACVIACQSENNIPTVGKEEVLNGREMHWIRVDRYYQKEEDGHLSAAFQPVPCMHCETAPCEYVCPVGATAHSDEGLNQMVYNRCVGTRYCSDNCPYKVRRFNFFHYADHETPVIKLGRNPDVTVRSRGVMEKCTYCVQRINEVRITSQLENRDIGDQEIKTACQAVCPTSAIQFGNIKDQGSQVAQWKGLTLNYGLVDEDLNTRPRTTYLAQLKNPNPQMARESGGDGPHAA